MGDVVRISLIAAGLVFLALVLLWVLMLLLVRITQKKPAQPTTKNDALENGDLDLECKHKAAAAALAAAIALLNTSSTTVKQKRTENPSPWQAAHRSQQWLRKANNQSGKGSGK